MENQIKVKRSHVDYQNSKIYKIVNDVNDFEYIGSTASSLHKRICDHRRKSKLGKTRFFTAMRNIGSNHFRILLVENFPCTSKAELEAREYAVIKSLPRDKLYNDFDGRHSDGSKQLMKDNSHLKGKFKENHPTFKRGFISAVTRTAKWGITDLYLYTWYDQGKKRCKAFSYGAQRTKQQAYAECENYRDQMFPLTTTDHLNETPTEGCPARETLATN